jgi:prepilin-type N-terminal cleavage/methylation domain-containing protein
MLPARRRTRRRGFTMVEMIVATALLGVGIAACVACIGTATRASGMAEEYTAVQVLAREKLAEIELEGTREGADEGDFGQERPGFAWETLAAPSGVPGLRQVRLTLIWGPEDRPRREEFVTFVKTER